MTRARPVRWPLALAGALASALVVAAAGAGVPAHATATDDPLVDQQYGLHQIGAPHAWAANRGGGVIVAVVDTGVDVHHPELQGRLRVVPGSDLGDGDDDPDDELGHGTHVAGIIGAAAGNGEGIAGAAPDVSILPVKVWADGLTPADVLLLLPRAIRFAVDHGAKVINLSVVTYGAVGALRSSSVVGAIETPCQEAFVRGALCIVAAGNGGDEPSGYARDFNAVVVTANDESGRHADIAQHADTKWSLSGPGVGVVSTVPVEQGSYALASGTSMSTPHVAAVAALLAAQGHAPGAIASQLSATAEPTPDGRVDGAGIVNAPRAVGVPVDPPPAAPAGATSPAGGATAGGAGTGSGSEPAPGGTGDRQGKPTADAGAGASAPGGAVAVGPGGERIDVADFGATPTTAPPSGGGGSWATALVVAGLVGLVGLAGWRNARAG